MTLPTLIYGYDPLCGWCYVFGPSIAALRRELGSEVRLTIAQGGLVTGDRVKPMRAMREYLQRAIPEAERRSGVTFGKAFTRGLMLEDDYAMASEPACRAVFAALELARGSEAGLDFALSLTHAIYFDGRKPDEPETLSDLARRAGLDADALVDLWRSPQSVRTTRERFDEARAAGITMYPTLLLRTGERSVEVLRGFAPPVETVLRVREALRMAGLPSLARGGRV